MSNLKTDIIVTLLNNLIEEAVKDGGDLGGAYNQNQNNLKIAINNILSALDLFDYEVISNKNPYNWSSLQIKKRCNNIEE